MFRILRLRFARRTVRRRFGRFRRSCMPSGGKRPNRYYIGLPAGADAHVAYHKKKKKNIIHTQTYIYIQYPILYALHLFSETESRRPWRVDGAYVRDRFRIPAGPTRSEIRRGVGRGEPVRHRLTCEAHIKIYFTKRFDIRYTRHRSSCGPSGVSGSTRRRWEYV